MLGECRDEKGADRSVFDLVFVPVSFSRETRITRTITILERRTPVSRTVAAKRIRTKPTAKGNLFLKLSSKVLIYVKANVIAERIRDLSVPCKYLPRELHGMSRKNWHTDVRYLARRNNRTLTHA